MITDEQRKIFKAVIGKKHIKKIAAFLNELGLANRQGEKYSEKHVSNVYSGRNPHPEMEAGIWKFVQFTAQRQKEEETAKAEMLRKIKETIES